MSDPAADARKGGAGGEGQPRVVLGVTGASGIPIALRTAEALAARAELVTVVSEAARKTARHEVADPDAALERFAELSAATYDEDEIAAAVASGSVAFRGMAIVPASMNTVAAIASGRADSLITRTAGVCLKERRTLVVVPRETPLSEIHLRNLTDLAGMGVDVVPPVLGFYYDPDGIDDVIDHVTGRVLDRFGFDHDLYESWGDLD